ncbi:MAG TPA: hypothetical protein VEK07_06960 [Polyangiaceae bacterium]|nr:hypothetical protein [Polyangiaceae bacterium]
MTDAQAIRPPIAAPAPTEAGDPATESLGRLAAALGEDALFVLASGGHDKDALETLTGRRAAAYTAAVQGQPHPRMLSQFDAWLVDMARALAPVSPPRWMPMMEVIGDKVTLEIGARGLRSLFSSKPSDREVARVKRYGTLSVRALRAVYCADGPLDAEERTTIAALVAALGMPEGDSATLLVEAPIAPETLDVYGEIDPAIARAVVRGAWLAAAGDGIDPREEHVIRVIAHKTGVTDDDLEAARREAQEKVDARSRLGAAAVDGVRFVVSDLRPEQGGRLAAAVGTLTIPRRWRNEALASIVQAAPVTLARRHTALSSAERFAVLGITWAAALIDSPSIARRALLQARWEKVAADLGEEDAQARLVVERWILDALAAAARAWT